MNGHTKSIHQNTCVIVPMNSLVVDGATGVLGSSRHKRHFVSCCETPSDVGHLLYKPSQRFQVTKWCLCLHS